MEGAFLPPARISKPRNCVMAKDKPHDWKVMPQLGSIV
jgi:hypothetical protein